MGIYASVNSTCSQPPPPPPGLTPWHCIFFALDGKFPEVGTLELSNLPGGDEKRGQMPRPPSTIQHFSLIAQSKSAILSILMCFFVFAINVFLCNSARIVIKTSRRDDMHQFVIECNSGLVNNEEMRTYM